MVDIIIVNWNSGEYLQKCISSIFCTDNKNFISKIFVIDNNSKDSSVDKIIINNQIEIIRNKENVGFSKAANQGFKLSTAEYVLLLNPDTELLDRTLADCINFMNNRHDVDILGCRLLDDNGEVSPSCARFPTASKIFIDCTGISKLFPSIFPPAILMTDWDHKDSRYVDQVMGAFMFMRLSIFEKVGFFDEQFFVYCEELDFSKRVSNLGGKSFFNTDISARHSGEGTTKRVKAFRLYLNIKSRLQYIKKHSTIFGYCLVFLGTFCIEPFSRSVFLLSNGKTNEIKDVFKAYRMLLLNRKKHIFQEF
jgi:GT2 family glycosyltransferase